MPGHTLLVWLRSEEKLEDRGENECKRHCHPCRYERPHCPSIREGISGDLHGQGLLPAGHQRPAKEEGGESYHFVLTPKGTKVTDAPEGYTVIETPVKSTVCMTSLQLSNFIKLSALDAVVGITSTRHLFNADMQKRLKEGKTHKIGIEGNFDNEVIMGIHPDVILISPFKRGGYDALTEVGIPLIPHLGYKEMTPLGQAEWIKFVGLLIGKEEQANRIFAEIEKRYQELVQLTAQVKKRPVVFSGELRGGNWYAVGGKASWPSCSRMRGPTIS